MIKRFKYKKVKKETVFEWRIRCKIKNSNDKLIERKKDLINNLKN